MKQIEAFDILTNSIRKYLHEAQANGSRNRLLQIISPCDPLNLQPLISEFDQLQNSTPRLEKLFERTTEILDTWNTFVQLPKDGESLCYRIDESCKIWLKSAGIDPEQWSEGSDYLIYTWDSTAHIINEVNGYLRRKIRPGAVPQAKENKLINNISSYIERAIKATIQTFTETFSYRPDETALRLFLKQEIKYLKAQEIDFKNKCETDQCEAARRKIQEYFNNCNDQMQRIELDINACVTNSKPQNMVNDYAVACLYSLFHKDLLNEGKDSTKASNTIKSKAGKLTQPQIALIYYFNDEIISPDNADAIATNYGFTSKESGHKIYQAFTYWSKNSNRHAVNDISRNILSNKITKFESIEPYIKGEENKRKLLAEIQTLRAALDPD